jgi:hypothetical protein
MEEELAAWAENLESFPRSRGSHEWGAEWSLVSLQMDSEKKSFLIAHTTPDQSPFYLVPSPQIIKAKNSAAGRRRLWTTRDNLRGADRERGAQRRRL